jgi:hypothetical protein
MQKKQQQQTQATKQNSPAATNVSYCTELSNINNNNNK